MRNSVEKEKKRRKILLFGSIAAAVVVALSLIHIFGKSGKCFDHAAID